MLDSIVLSILGNSAYDILKKIILKEDNDLGEAVIEELINIFNNSSERFFNRFGDKFGKPESCFLSDEQNWRIIVRSIFYSSDILSVNDFYTEGYGYSEEYLKEGVEYFYKTLQEEIGNSWVLDKIIAEKKHIRDIQEIKSMVQKQNNMLFNPYQESDLIWNIKIKELPKELRETWDIPSKMFESVFERCSEARRYMENNHIDRASSTYRSLSEVFVEVPLFKYNYIVCLSYCGDNKKSIQKAEEFLDQFG